jgi:hypothetical protein
MEEGDNSRLQESTFSGFYNGFGLTIFPGIQSEGFLF